MTDTFGMNIAQRILHVGGRNNAAGYVEFGSIQAVEALVRQVLRDLPPAKPAAEPAVEPVAVAEVRAHIRNGFEDVAPRIVWLPDENGAHPVVPVGTKLYAPLPAAPAVEPRPVTPYTCPKCHALWLHWPSEQTGIDTDTLNCRSAKWCDYCEKGGVEQLKRLERVPASLKAPVREPSPPPPAESVKPPGMAVQALAGEIVAALLADEKDGGYDLTAGMFGPAFSVLVRRWAAAEWNSPPAEPAVDNLSAIEKEIAETCMDTPPGWRCTRRAGHDGPCAAVPAPEDIEFVRKGMARLKESEAPPPPAEPARTSQDVCTVPLLSDAEILQLTPLWFKKYTDGVLLGHARAIEQLVRRKAGL